MESWWHGTMKWVQRIEEKSEWTPRAWTEISGTDGSRGVKVDGETVNPGSRRHRTPGAGQQDIFRPYFLRQGDSQCITWSSFHWTRLWPGEKLNHGCWAWAAAGWGWHMSSHPSCSPLVPFPPLQGYQSSLPQAHSDHTTFVTSVT